MAKSKKKSSGKAMQNKLKLDTMKINNLLGIEYLNGRKHGWALAITIMAWVLHREFGFGARRLLRLVRELNDFSLEVIAYGPDGKFRAKEGEFQGLSIQDIVNALDEECNIEVNFDTGKFGLKKRKEVTEHAGDTTPSDAETETISD